VRSANPSIKRRTNVVGIFSNDTSIIRLVASQLLEQQEEWQLERRRFFSEATMAKIPVPKEPLELKEGHFEMLSLDAAASQSRLDHGMSLMEWFARDHEFFVSPRR
jgi:hypothetical protein